MTTKELENKLKISGNTCIHCPTLELAKKVLSIFHKLGLKWYNEICYTKRTNWNKYEKNTVYCPFEGDFSSLGFSTLIGRKIISAEEFIALYTEDKEFNLENYVPKGELTGFPKEIIARMLDCQEEQGNKRDINVFERDKEANNQKKGFNWLRTQEGQVFWFKVIGCRIFDLFFEKYPKKEDNQEFRVGDKVYDIMYKSCGIITNISKGKTGYPLIVKLENGKINTYTIDGRVSSCYKTPHLLHYRDDYDYSVIDFNNLPKRQEPKRWRAKEGGCYHFVSFDERCWFYSNGDIDDYASTDNNNYNSGNYFRTEVEAEIIAQKLNSYFKQLIKEEHDTHRN